MALQAIVVRVTSSAVYLRDRRIEVYHDLELQQGFIMIVSIFTYVGQLIGEPFRGPSCLRPDPGLINHATPPLESFHDSNWFSDPRTNPLLRVDKPSTHIHSNKSSDLSSSHVTVMLSEWCCDT